MALGLGGKAKADYIEDFSNPSFLIERKGYKWEKHLFF